MESWVNQQQFKQRTNQRWEHIVQIIPNGCLDDYEVKVNKDSFKHQANKGKMTDSRD